jgi:DNA-binding NarL/FixJ family response regulator
VVGEPVNGQEAVARVAELGPDVVLMEVRMRVMDGLQATRAITAGGDGGPRVLVLTTFGLDDYVYEALWSGASGFLLKDASAGELAEAVRMVAASVAFRRGGLRGADLVQQRGRAPAGAPALVSGRQRVRGGGGGQRAEHGRPRAGAGPAGGRAEAGIGGGRAGRGGVRGGRARPGDPAAAR